MNGTWWRFRRSRRDAPVAPLLLRRPDRSFPHRQRFPGRALRPLSAPWLAAIARQDRRGHAAMPLSRFPLRRVRQVCARTEPGDNRSGIVGSQLPGRREGRVRLALARRCRGGRSRVVARLLRVRARPIRMVGEALSHARDQGKLFAALREFLDTSHISFLHGTALDGGRMATSTFRIDSDGKSVGIIRELKGDAPTPSSEKQYGLRGIATFDRKLELIAYLPNLHIVRNTFTFPDRPGHPPHVRINVMPITPSRENELYQFLIMTASYPESHPPRAHRRDALGARRGSRRARSDPGPL